MKINGAEYEELEIKPDSLSQYLTKEPKAYTEEKTASSINDAGKHAESETEPLTLANSKWVKNLNEDLNFESTTGKLGKCWKVIGNYFLNRTPIAWKTRARMEKWDCIKFKSVSAHQKKQLPKSRKNKTKQNRMGENLH
jgi:hypothetical protein